MLSKEDGGAGDDDAPGPFAVTQKNLAQIDEATLQHIDLCGKEQPQSGAALSDY